MSVKFTYSKSGPSGRGEGRVRYYVDAVTAGVCPVFIGTTEGKGSSWTLDDGRGYRYKSRKEASLDLLDRYLRRGRDWLFVLAIVKGLIEHQDGTTYFGPLGGFQAHVHDAITKGLIEEVSLPVVMGDLHCTPWARKLYEELGLAGLPQKRLSRAYGWDWNRVLGFDWIGKLPRDAVQILVDPSTGRP